MSASCAGQESAGTPHILLGVLDSGNAAVKKALTKAGVQLEQLKSKVGAQVAV